MLSHQAFAILSGLNLFQGNCPRIRCHIVHHHCCFVSGPQELCLIWIKLRYIQEQANGAAFELAFITAHLLTTSMTIITFSMSIGEAGMSTMIPVLVLIDGICLMQPKIKFIWRLTVLFQGNRLFSSRV